MMLNRKALLIAGMRLEVATISAMFVIAACSIVGGIVAGSTLLLAVGAGSAIDLFCACALYRRLHLELHGDDEAHFHRLEHRTAKLIGALLTLTSIYVLAIALRKFLAHATPDNSILGIGVSLGAALSMPFLGRAKMRIAAPLASKSLNADAVGTLVCGLMSAVVLMGLVANALLHWWWIDSVGAVLLVPLLLKESHSAWFGE